MKRIGMWLLMLLLLLGLCGCDEPKPQEDSNEDEDYTWDDEWEFPSADTATVMFREGLTVPQMAALLEEKQVCTAEEFLDAVQNGVYDFDFLQDIPTDPNRIYRLEGYLFPDTYEFYVDSSGEAVVNRLLKNFEKRIQDILPQIEEQGWTLDEAVVFASMIQGEADTAENMKKVSRVLHNRMASGSGFKKLQLCSTRDYVNFLLENGDYDADALKQAYNTYVRDGLPIGPINNPGLAALTAALNPSTDATMKQCYYFATDYKTGITYFSKTYAEHQAIIKKHGITDIG